MDLTTIQSMLKIGETVAVEFKRCGNGIESDTYETVCSFLNRFGGDLFLGVLNDGTVSGVPKNAVSDMIKNFIKVVSNQALFSPTVYLVPEIIEFDEAHTIIHIHVPPSSEVHSYKKVIYDRVDDADIKITATGAIAQMYIRKQNIFTEKKIYPYAKFEDLRLDLLPKIRIMAQNHAGGTHPWISMDDTELLKSAGLYGRDIATGDEGFNLAAIMLLGKDDVILNVAPAYVTDAVVRKVNIDRYDDREVIKTNLIESYSRLMDFGKKHLPDKFFLENDVNKSLRNIILREMVSNVLMHREFTGSYTAKFVIEEERMYVENANRALGDGFITEDNLEPVSKNPIIASFFRNIGCADQLGSGVRNLFKYSKYYSGMLPEFVEGDVFRIIVPLDEKYSFDFGQNGQTNQSDQSDQSDQSGQSDQMKLSQDEIILLNLIKEYPDMTNMLLAEKLGWSAGRVKYYIQKLKQFKKIKRNGTSRNGRWEVL
ncbi:MAG: putative DNA binding domain-containing protein [Lachnospiraceae bacterium]|nr:putative DNA binding domain-containing protein [Lachnospiraceae bacterium]